MEVISLSELERLADGDSLYSRTGNVADANTMLVNRAELRKLVEAVRAAKAYVKQEDTLSRIMGNEPAPELAALRESLSGLGD